MKEEKIMKAEKEVKNYLLEEYKIAKNGYNTHSLDELKQNYYRGQIILLEDMLNWYFGLHLRFFN